MDDFLKGIIDRLGPEGTVAVVFLFLLLNFTGTIAKMYLDRRDRAKIATAAACNYPVELVAPLRSVIERQSQNAKRTEEAVGRLEEAVSRMADNSSELVLKIVEALTELRAKRGRSR